MSCRYRNECPSYSGWCEGPKQDFSRCIQFLITAYENVKGEITEMKGESFNNISRPSHYCDGRSYEPRKVIHDWGLNFNLGNAVKYISRAGRKGSKIEDLEKAIQYIEFELEELRNEEEKKSNKEKENVAERIAEK